MLSAYVWLREPLGPAKLAGAAAVLAGVALTRLGQARLQIPAQL
jgi:drug/metabolite transporter (DMT)-like permease